MGFLCSQKQVCFHLIYFLTNAPCNFCTQKKFIGVGGLTSLVNVDLIHLAYIWLLYAMQFSLKKKQNIEEGELVTLVKKD